MSLPMFDPWSSRKSPDGRAYRAYCAYLRPDLGTLGTIGTGADTISTVPFPAQVNDWLDRLSGCLHDPAGCPTPAAPRDHLIKRAIHLCLSGWVTQLLSLGWTDADMFGVSDCHGHGGGLVQVLGAGRIKLATSDVAYFERGSEAFAHVRSGSRLSCVRVIWDTTT